MDTQAPLRVILFLGSVREYRLCERVAKFTQNNLEKAGYEVTVFDPLVMELPMLKKALHFFEDKSRAPAWLIEADKKIRSMDAFILITCEYNSGIPPALSNILSHFSPDAYICKPAGIVGYSNGNLGGARAVMNLRSMLSDLQMVSIPQALYIPKVNIALTLDGKPQNDALKKDMQAFMEHVKWYAQAMRNHRNKVGSLHWSML